MSANYKSILWVEDNIPKNFNNEYDVEEIKRIFGNHMKYIRPYNGVLDALRYIGDNIGQFDIAVLDINLEEGGADDEVVKNNINELLENAKIIPRKPEELGFSIFQYLLILGFPIDRIIFRTAYKDTNQGNYKAFENANFEMPPEFDKTSDDNLRNMISELYSNDNSYFKVRKIVFEAVEYWLSEKESKDDNNEKFKISKSESNRILNDVKTQLPLRPAKSMKKGDKTYREYHAVLAALAAPFEADINFKNPYQQVMKLLRNWTFHGKFSDPDDLSERIFLLLFLTAMRALFSPYIGKDETCFEYEKEAFDFLENNKENNKENYTDEERKKHIYSFYYDIGGGKQLNIKLYDLLSALGREKDKNMKYGYLLNILLSRGLGVWLKPMDSKKIETSDEFSGIPIYFNFNKTNSEFLNGIIEYFPLTLMKLDESTATRLRQSCLNTD